MTKSRKYGLAGVTQMVAEGLILVSSTTERGVADDSKDSGLTVPQTQTKAAPAARKRRSAAAAKEEGQVSQALRTVYQKAVDEDIPSEMLDLLSKLD
jgi:hypothetical protein